MPERRTRFHQRVEDVQLSANSWNIRVNAGIDRLVNGIHFTLGTNPKERRHAFEQVEAFRSDVLRYLSDSDLSNMLLSMRASNSQIALAEFLIERHRHGRIKTVESIGRVSPSGIPYVAHHSEGSLGEEDRHTLHSFLDASQNYKHVNFIVRWGVRQPYAHGFGIFGELGSFVRGSLNFLTLPKPAESESQVLTHLGLGHMGNGETDSVRIADQGNAFHLTRRFKNGEELSTHYTALGDFLGRHTRQKFVLYGENQ